MPSISSRRERIWFLCAVIDMNSRVPGPYLTGGSCLMCSPFSSKYLWLKPKSTMKNTNRVHSWFRIHILPCGWYLTEYVNEPRIVFTDSEILWFYVNVHPTTSVNTFDAIDLTVKSYDENDFHWKCNRMIKLFPWSISMWLTNCFAIQWILSIEKLNLASMNILSRWRPSISITIIFSSPSSWSP